MDRNGAWNSLKYIFLLVFVLFLPLCVVAQNGDQMVDMLVGMGFENVSWGENERERVYVVENSAYRLMGVGVGKALDEIGKSGLPEDGRKCRLILLENNVPQVSLTSCGQGNGVELTRRDWDINYDLGDSWKTVRGRKRENSSIFKVDLLLYPDFSFRNSRLSVPYQIRLNINPTLQVSLWRGGKITAQVIVPVVNDYGYKYDDIRPGFVTISQAVRLPYNVFVTGTAGFFNNNRAGVDLAAEYHSGTGLFWFDGRVSYTIWGEWGQWKSVHGVMDNIAPFRFGYSKEDNRITGQLGVNYFWKRFNTQFALRGESFLGGDCGVRFDMLRHFKSCSIGFYGTYIPSDWWNSGINAGFKFQIALPPYKYSRRGYVPRVMPSRNWGFAYDAGGTFVYGERFKAELDKNINNDIKYNPLYLKSEILNY